MIYLASPYSHPDECVRHARYIAACKATAKLTAEGKIVFSPIVHSHNLCQFADLPADWDFWSRIDIEILSRCDEFYILPLDGWNWSKGVGAELQYANENGKAITILDVEVYA